MCFRAPPNRGGMAPRNGTGYIGLDQWLALNQPQSAAMADNLVSGINAQGQKAESLLGEAGEYLQHGIDGASLNYNDEDFAGNNGLLRAEDAAKNAKATVDAGWQGPTSLEGIKPYEMGRGVATNAGQQANLAGDFYGRQALLSKEYGKGGGYSPGSQRLDSALAGAAGGDKIDAAKSQWGNLLGKFDAANTAANASAKAAEQRNKDVAKQYADNAAAMQRRHGED